MHTLKRLLKKTLLLQPLTKFKTKNKWIKRGKQLHVYPHMLLFHTQHGFSSPRCMCRRSLFYTHYIWFNRVYVRCLLHVCLSSGMNLISLIVSSSSSVSSSSLLSPDPPVSWHLGTFDQIEMMQWVLETIHFCYHQKTPKHRLRLFISRIKFISKKYQLK